MKATSRLKEGLQAWRPKRYRALSAKSYREVLGMTGAWVLLCLALMVLAGVPLVALSGESLQRQFSSFETFSISTNITVSEPVVISSSPEVVIAPAQENLSGEKVLLNKEGIVLKRALWRGSRTIPWSTVLDVPGHASLYAKWLRWALIALLPTIVLIIGLMFAIEAAALVALSGLLGLIISRAFGFRISLRQLFKVATAALIPLAALQLIPFFYLRWWLVPVALYALLVFLATWLVGESRMERKHA